MVANPPDDAGPEQQDQQKDQQKSPQTILEQEIKLGLDELERPARGLLLSGLSAGLDIGFSALVVAVILSLAGPDLEPVSMRLLLAGAYSVGFIFVIFGRSELFTEHTTLATMPVMAGRARLSQLLRLWSLIYFSNLVGTAIFAALMVTVGPPLGSVDPALFATHVLEFVDHVWWVMFLSAVLAGWMMGLVSWLVTAARSTISEIFFVALVTGTIGLAQLHHCIVGSVEILAAHFATGSPSLAGYGRFLVLATLGNIVGGVVFVAIIKFGHASQTRARVFQSSD